MKASNLFASVCFVLFAPFTAGAEMISETADVKFGSLPWTEHNLSFSRFDPLMGTLNSVSFSIGQEISGTVHYHFVETDHDHDTDTVTATLAAVFQLLDGDGGVLASARAEGVDVTTYGKGEFQPTYTFDNKTGSGSGSSAGLLSFVGTSPITLHGTMQNKSTVTAVSNTGVNEDHDIKEKEISFSLADASVTLTYDYTPAGPIPEPSTAALGLAGLIGLGLWRRKACKPRGQL